MQQEFALICEAPLSCERTQSFYGFKVTQLVLLPENSKKFKENMNVCLK